MKTSRIPKDTLVIDQEERKRLIAYQLWEDEGRPEGKAEEHWDKACLVVMSIAEGEAAPPPVWLKQQKPNLEHTLESAPVVESLTKQSTTRHAA